MADRDRTDGVQPGDAKVYSDDTRAEAHNDTHGATHRDTHSDTRGDTKTHRDDGRTLGEIISDLTTQFSTLIREEIELAKTEISQNLSRAMKDVVSLAIGGFIAYAGFLVLLLAAAWGLALLMPLWVAGLIVGGVVLIIGAIMVMGGIQDLRKHSLMPRQTIESLKEDRDWAKEQIK